MTTLSTRIAAADPSETQELLVEHYSREPLGELSDARAENMALTDIELMRGKPRGLWVSVPGEDDWRTWCESESFDIERLRCCQALELNLTDILMLDTLSSLDAFDCEYGLEMQFGAGLYGTKWVIDWRRVAAEYAGIVIAPYQWKRRFDGRVSSWYYSWDCASGCIWSPHQALMAVIAKARSL